MSDRSRKPRLSLTKSQLRTGAGAELLALCQSITADGVLTNKEIVALRSWLKENHSADLPSMEYLIETVEQIIADRKVTKDERIALQKAIETVLPPEFRKQAAQQRRNVEARSLAQRQLKRNIEQQQKREERARNRPIASANFMVAGVHYEGRPTLIRKHAKEDDKVLLVRDHRNKFSPNAIDVRIGTIQIGYVPEDEAVDLAPCLDDGSPYQAWITKILTGARVPIPVVQAYLYRAETDVEGVVRPGQSAPRRQKQGCMAVVAGSVLVLLALSALWHCLESGLLSYG